MSKILTGKEMLEIVSGIVTGELKLAMPPLTGMCGIMLPALDVSR